jgi:hypothetical protein
MNNVHPRILGSILARLQEGSVIKSAKSVSADNSVFEVEQGGATRELTVPKVDVSTYLAGQTIEIMAKAGDRWETIMERVSAKYRLFLVPGVDYTTDTAKVEFSEADSAVKTYEVLPDSISLKGSITVKAICGTQRARPAIAVCCALDEQKTQLALVSKVFPAHEVILIGPGGLPAGFCDGLIEHLTDLGIELIPSAQDLAGAEVIDLINDGVSDLAIVKTASEQMWFVRYRLLSASGEDSAG